MGPRPPTSVPPDQWSPRGGPAPPEALAAGEARVTLSSPSLCQVLTRQKFLLHGHFQWSGLFLEMISTLPQPLIPKSKFPTVAFLKKSLCKYLLWKYLPSTFTKAIGFKKIKQIWGLHNADSSYKHLIKIRCAQKKPSLQEVPKSRHPRFTS